MEFRSDTMTLPTSDMRDAMRDAEVGDDVCGEDPTVNRLEELAAKKLDKEAALFVPSGVFGNQLAIGVHAKPGDEIIVDPESHIIKHENAACAAFFGVQTITVTPQNGCYMTAKEIKSRLRPVHHSDIHFPDTGLVIVENSLSNGAVIPLDEMIKIKAAATQNNIPVHLDGARIFNAAITLGVDVSKIAKQADSVTFCLSKGLGAPVGSILLGSAGFIKNARYRRKMMGGGMRQAGVLAAPGIIALEKGIENLKTDHENARLLCELLSEISGISINPDLVKTNMVFCAVSKSANEKTTQGLVDYLNKNKIKTFDPIDGEIRFVTSSRVNKKDVYTLVKSISQYLKN